MKLIFSLVQHTMMKTPIQVYPTSVQELVYIDIAVRRSHATLQLRSLCMQMLHARVAQMQLYHCVQASHSDIETPVPTQMSD